MTTINKENKFYFFKSKLKKKYMFIFFSFEKNIFFKYYSFCNFKSFIPKLKKIFFSKLKKINTTNNCNSSTDINKTKKNKQFFFKSSVNIPKEIVPSIIELEIYFPKCTNLNLTFCYANLNTLFIFFAKRFKSEGVFFSKLCFKKKSPFNYAKKLSKIIQKKNIDFFFYKSNTTSKIFFSFLAVFISTCLVVCGFPTHISGSPNTPTLDKAIEHLDRQFRAKNWRIEIDIDPDLKIIPKNIILNQLIKPLKLYSNPIIFNLVKTLIENNFVKPGYTNFSNFIYNAKSSFEVNQPLGTQLGNFLLRSIDDWGEKLPKQYNKGIRRRQNPSYTRLLHVLATMRKKNWEKLPFATSKTRYNYKNFEGQSEQDIQKAIRETISILKNDETYRRISYLRYESTIIIGIAGCGSFARQIQNTLQNKLKKIGINKAVSCKPFNKPFNFLGYWIVPPQKSVLVKKYSENSVFSQNRIMPRLGIRAPLKKLYNRLGCAGFFSHKIDGYTLRKHWVSCCPKLFEKMSFKKKINIFNEIIKSLNNYYYYVDNRRNFARFMRKLRLSLLFSLQNHKCLFTNNNYQKEFNELLLFSIHKTKQRGLSFRRLRFQSLGCFKKIFLFTINHLNWFTIYIICF